MPVGGIREEIDSMLKDLLFEDQRSTLTAKLSGGMKRKLRYSHNIRKFYNIYTYTC